MKRIACIVEGHGEVQAVPVLLRRVAAYLGCDTHLEISQPYRGKRNLLVKEGELERIIELMANKTAPDGALLVLLDADDDCPAQLGPALLRRAQAVRGDRAMAVVLAHREYESWFAAAAVSLRGKRGLPADLEPPVDPDRVGKGFIAGRMADSYSETIDQPALTAMFDIDAARRSDSFDKLIRDVARLLEVPLPGSSNEDGDG